MMDEEKNNTQSPQPSDIGSAADAAKARNADRKEIEEAIREAETAPGEEEAREEPPDLPAGSNRITVGFVFKCLGAGLFLLVLILMFYRIHQQDVDYADRFLWTDENIRAYQEKGALTVWKQRMSSFTLTLSWDENDKPLDTYSYRYSPYSETDTETKKLRGHFFVSDPMYIEETRQMLLTLRVNRTTGEAVKECYRLDTAPTGDAYFFALTDGTVIYSDYEYITIEENTYLYYRLIFNNVSYTPVTVTRENASKVQICEMKLQIFYRNFYNLSSPLETMTVANNALPIQPVDTEKFLPVAKEPALKEDPALMPEKD